MELALFIVAALAIFVTVVLISRTQKFKRDLSYFKDRINEAEALVSNTRKQLDNYVVQLNKAYDFLAKDSKVMQSQKDKIDNLEKLLEKEKEKVKALELKCSKCDTEEAVKPTTKTRKKAVKKE